MSARPGDVIAAPVMPAMPEELPDGSVVLDSEGDAWQRDDDLWRLAGGSEPGRTWPGLLQAYGPVRVLHVPGDEPTPQTSVPEFHVEQVLGGES